MLDESQESLLHDACVSIWVVNTITIVMCDKFAAPIIMAHHIPSDISDVIRFNDLIVEAAQRQPSVRPCPVVLSNQKNFVSCQ
jgi:hypothetical protein